MISYAGPGKRLQREGRRICKVIMTDATMADASTRRAALSHSAAGSPMGVQKEAKSAMPPVLKQPLHQ